MVRFASEDAPGFKSVVGELERLVATIRFLADEATKMRADPYKDRPTKTAMNGGTTVSIQGPESQCAGIRIWGDVTRSNVVDGDLVISGNLTFSG
jgi:hypothetical protein